MSFRDNHLIPLPLEVEIDKVLFEAWFSTWAALYHGHMLVGNKGEIIADQRKISMAYFQRFCYFFSCARPVPLYADRYISQLFETEDVC